MKCLVAILVCLFICAELQAKTPPIPNELFRWESELRPAYNLPDEANNLLTLNPLTPCRHSVSLKKDLGRILKLNLISSLVFRSPCLTDLDLPNCGVHLFTQPDIHLSSSKFKFLTPRAFNWELKCGFNLQFNKILFFLGYELSNYSLYKGMKKNLFSHAINDSRFSHSIFIGTALKF